MIGHLQMRSVDRRWIGILLCERRWKVLGVSSPHIYYYYSPMNTALEFISFSYTICTSVLRASMPKWNTITPYFPVQLNGLSDALPRPNARISWCISIQRITCDCTEEQRILSRMQNRFHQTGINANVFAHSMRSVLNVGGHTVVRRAIRQMHCLLLFLGAISRILLINK